MNFPFDKYQTLLLACSFGPDSMALLNMLVEEGFKPIVCHVNYHRRPESDFEQSGLEQYCLEHDLELDVLDTKGMKPKGNFQAWARSVRYRFFLKRYQEYGAEGLLVAHQQDDHIETYIMQKARKTKLISYGLLSKTTLFEMTIYRPLLDFSKASLKTYCDQNHVPYAIDSSNLEDHYQRNRIRHSLVEKMDQEERKQVLEEIEITNQKNKLEILVLEKEFFPFEKIPVSRAKNLSPQTFTFLLYLILSNHSCHQSLSLDRIEQILRLCSSDQPNKKVVLNKKWAFERRYDNLSLVQIQTIVPFSFIVSKPEPLTCPYFSVDFSEGFLKDFIQASSYPLTIRPARPGDRIQVGKMVKRINRLYIDWKLPVSLREIWPVVVDKNGLPIYIPRFQKDTRFPRQSNFEIKKSFDYVE